MFDVKKNWCMKRKKFGIKNWCKKAKKIGVTNQKILV